jgi:hypothetical protein
MVRRNPHRVIDGPDWRIRGKTHRQDPLRSRNVRIALAVGRFSILNVQLRNAGRHTKNLERAPVARGQELGDLSLRWLTPDDVETAYPGLTVSRVPTVARIESVIVGFEESFVITVRPLETGPMRDEVFIQVWIVPVSPGWIIRSN